MKKFFCTLCFFAFILSAQAQYLPVVKQNRVWYSFYDGWFDGTEILGVGPDSIVNGNNLPTLVRKDQNLNTLSVLGTLEEDTTQGTLKVDLNGYSYTIDFAASVGDSMQFSEYGGGSIYLKVDSIYTITDFRNISRKVLTLQAPDQNFCSARKVRFIEGLGPERSLVNPYHDCSLSDIPQHTLRCVIDESIKIYGDTVQQCFVLSEENISFNQTTIFPNPVQDWLQIESKELLQTYTLMNSSGQVIKSGQFPAENKLPVADLSSGLYFIKLNARHGETRLLRFMKL